MAIYHFSASFVAGAKSPVAAAAYRHRTTMVDAVRGGTWSYASRADLAHAEIKAPTHPPTWLAKILAQPEIADQSAALWNKVLFEQPRADGQTCRDIIIALPAELTRDQAIAAMREFVETHLTSKGVVVDWVIHDKGDGNPHVHLTHTLRPLAEHGFGAKVIPLLADDGAPVRNPKGKIVYSQFIAGTRQELIDIRHAWADTANKHLALAGYDVRIDASSYVDLGIAIPPTSHLSPSAAAIAREKQTSEVLAKLGIELKHSAAAIIAKPEHLLAIITTERSTFTVDDIERALARFVLDPADRDIARGKVMASPALELIKPATPDDPRDIYSTRAMIDLERGMASNVQALCVDGRHGVLDTTLVRAISKIEADKTKDPAAPFRLSDEQREAVDHVTRPGAVTCVVGKAGAGKSTLLSAANLAWTSNGSRVVGAALSGKAASSLQESSGIPSRTNTAWLNAWAKGFDTLRPGDVFVLDEAGMVASKHMAAIVQHVHDAGAKLVAVGDPVQLQPIEAGAAFRAIARLSPTFTLTEIRRQAEPWAREASADFGSGKVAAALDAYAERGCIKTPDTADDAVRMLVSDWSDARTTTHPDPKDLLVLAQTNADVLTLNTALRAVVAERGELSNEITVPTERGPRAVAQGDRLLCLLNAKFPDPAAGATDLQTLNNGLLGTVTSTNDGIITLALDAGRSVSFSPSVYNAFDHGYATTIHKSQGATVDSSFVLANPMMDNHLAYVAMSRHQSQATLYAPKDCFADRAALDRALGRDRQKSTTLDYKHEFANRRGIDTITSIAPRIAEAIEAGRAALAATWERATAALAEIRAGYAKAAAKVEMPVMASLSAPDDSTQPSRPVADQTLRYAVNRYAQSLEPVAQAKRQGNAALPHQAAALDKHTAALEALRPGAVGDLTSALKHDAPAIAAMASLKGLERAAVLVAGIEREMAVRTNPALRAERLVGQWHTLVDKHIELRAKSDTAGMKAVSVEMRTAAKALAADPAVVAVLASRPQDFGITDTGTLGRALKSPDVGKALAIAIDPPAVVQQKSHGWSM